jgi:hypothetical protein
MASTAAPETPGAARNSADPAPRSAADATPHPAPPEMIRTRHSPTGNFDVVILQSAARDDLADIGAILTGDPVFTVYLGVGDQKEWLLEYCVPGQSASSDSYQVNIDDAGSLVAPYPISTVIPRPLLERRISKHIVFHALLNASGTLQNIDGPGTDDPLAQQILDVLKEWQFRPARRNRTAIAVEVLLVVPARG